MKINLLNKMVLEVGKQPWLLFSMDMEGIKIGDIYPNNRVHSSVYLKYKVFLLVLRNYLFLWKFSFKKDIFSMRQRLRVVEEKLIGQWARGDSPKTLSFEIFFFSVLFRWEKIKKNENVIHLNIAFVWKWLIFVSMEFMTYSHFWVNSYF